MLNAICWFVSGMFAVIAVIAGRYAAREYAQWKRAKRLGMHCEDVGAEGWAPHW